MGSLTRRGFKHSYHAALAGTSIYDSFLTLFRGISPSLTNGDVIEMLKIFRSSDPPPALIVAKIKAQPRLLSVDPEVKAAAAADSVALGYGQRRPGNGL